MTGLMISYGSLLSLLGIIELYATVAPAPARGRVGEEAVRNAG